MVVIDVESVEHRVLAGARQLISRDRPVIVLEVLRNAAVAELRAFMSQANYVEAPGDASTRGFPPALSYSPSRRERVLFPAET